MHDSHVQQRFCGKCGERTKAGAAFCTSCGGPLSAPPQSAGNAPEFSNATGEIEGPERDRVTYAVYTLAFAESWEEDRRVVEEHRDVLLTDAADEELAALITSNKDDENVVGVLKEHRALLARCRREGIDSAFASYLQPPSATQGDQAADAEWNHAAHDPGEDGATIENRGQATDAEWDQTLHAVAEFVNARPWVASKLILEQRRNLLLTDTADEVLSSLIAQEDDDEGVRCLEEHRELLAGCRQKGIDAAFAEHSQKKPPFLKRVVEWLVVIGIIYLFFVIVGMFT